MGEYGELTIFELSGELTALADSTRKQSNLLSGMANEDFIELVNEKCERVMESDSSIMPGNRHLLTNYKNSFTTACKNIGRLRELVVI